MAVNQHFTLDAYEHIVEELETPLVARGAVEQVGLTAFQFAGRLKQAVKPMQSTLALRNHIKKGLTPEVLDVLNGHNTDRAPMIRTIEAMVPRWNQAMQVFSSRIAEVQEHRDTFREVPEATLRDLRKTWELLRNVAEKIEATSSLLPPAVAPRPIVPQPPRTTQPSPPRRRKQPPPQQRQKQQPPPPQQGEEPDRTHELQELEEDLEEQNKEDEKKHSKFDELIEKMKEALRELGNNGGMNSFEAPDEQGYPPPPTKNLSPSMDERKSSKEAKESSTPPLFTIEPPLRGYYRVSILDRYDRNSVMWTEMNQERAYPTHVSVPHSHKIKGKIRGKITLPMPEGYMIDPSSIEAQHPIKVTCDERGIIYLESTIPQEFEVAFGKSTSGIKLIQKPEGYHREDIVAGDLSADTLAFLSSVGSLPADAKAIKIAEYVQETLEYSNESSYNHLYKSDPSTYYQKIEEHKKADCDVANGYFIALCRRAGIPARMVVGHRVDGAHNGKGEITYSGHAWSEIWDGKRWRTIDATPAGEQEEGGDPLDTNCPEEGVDLKTSPQPKKKHVEDKKKQLERDIEAAKKKNQLKNLTSGELEELKARQEELQAAQEEALKKQMEENAELLEAQAEKLEADGKADGAREMREKAEALRSAIASGDEDAISRALQDANGTMERTNIAIVAKSRIALLTQQLGLLAAEAEESGEDDLIS